MSGNTLRLSRFSIYSYIGRNFRMNQSLVYLVLFSLSLSPGSVITTRGQVQMTDIVVLERGENELSQCSLMEERERARYEIHQITNSAALTAPIHSCNGVPGWRHVAFINMTDTRYNCPTGLTLTSYSKRTCGRYHALGGGCSSTTFSVRDLPYHIKKSCQVFHRVKFTRH